MINVRTIKKMQDGDIIHLKNGVIKKYKGGYEVPHMKIEIENADITIKWIKRLTKLFSKSCQIQFKNGKYYVSFTDHAYTKPQAKELAEKYKWSIVYEWKNLAHMAV